MIIEASRSITYGSSAIEFEVVRADRKTLDISVLPDRRVTVKAPINVLLEEIDRRVKVRARWILKQQQYFSQFDPCTTPRQYISGETHLYLGRQYRLKIQANTQASVKLKGRYLHIETPNPDNSIKTRELLEAWYLERARTKFNERLDICFTAFNRMGCDRPSLQIRQLSKRWGSLTANGAMILNRDLIRASSRHIDYVITHELCHLKYPDHSSSFCDLLNRMMPDWESRKLKLEQLLV